MPSPDKAHYRDLTHVCDTERAEWRALLTEPRLDMLPKEALIASIRDLSARLLALTDDDY